VIHSEQIGGFPNPVTNSKLLLAVLLVMTSTAFAQSARPGTIVVNAPTTFPIVFTKSISAKNAHAGDAVTARTTQIVRLDDSEVIPKGTKINGHVIAAKPFVYDTTPYARQQASVLSIRFDSIEIQSQAAPLDVTVRAMATPIASEDARTPINHDIDPSGTTVQVGGDQRYPWDAPVKNDGGDVVAYSRHDGVYAHLIANGACDGSSVEVSVGIYSASACGLYGFDQTSAEEVGSAAHPSTLTLVSTHQSPRIWKNSTALLEALPIQQSIASR
jgi:hypothetical protein